MALNANLSVSQKHGAHFSHKIERTQPGAKTDKAESGVLSKLFVKYPLLILSEFGHRNILILASSIAFITIHDPFRIAAIYEAADALIRGEVYK